MAKLNRFNYELTDSNINKLMVVMRVNICTMYYPKFLHVSCSVITSGPKTMEL